MKLGSGIQKFFILCLALGAISVLGSVWALMMDGSPYRFGRLAGMWFLVQLAGGVVLLYSGMFGLMTCNVTEITATGFNMKVAWIVFLVLAALFLFTVWIAFEDFQKHSEGATGDWVAVSIGVLTVVMTAFAYIQACRYFMRLHRLRRPYEQLLG